MKTKTNVKAGTGHARYGSGPDLEHRDSGTSSY